jgi:formylglycine-generating enzyme required for sulfatase activity/serine/threonine protein kinase
VASADELDRLDRQLSDLPLATVVRFDQLADEFESALRAGDAPDLGEFVARLEADEQARQLFAEHLRHLQAELTSTPHLDATAAQARQPQQVGEYRLLERLGAGGMGVVYKAIHTRLERPVAVKFPRFAALLDAGAAARFVREAKLLGQLQHPHIVRALDAGDSEHGPYLVTDFIEGETVEQLVRREGPLEFRRALQLALEAAGGLAHAHAQQIVHRDVKPSNLLLDHAGVLRVVDFGLAKAMATEASAESLAGLSHATGAGAFLGTVGYAAPEQLQTEATVDQRADVYALGCVVYFMLQGEPPHRGTLADRLRAEGERGARLELKSASVTPELAAVWLRMVNPRPEDRFQSMAEVERVLQQALDGTLEPLPRSVSRRTVLTMAGATALGGMGLWFWLAAERNGNVAPVRAKPTGPPPAILKPPLTADEVQTSQQAWAKHLGLPVRMVGAGGVPLVLLPPGEFEMGVAATGLPGLPPSEGDWRYRTPEVDRALHEPAHRIVISRPLYFGETEVTNAQFRAFVDATNYVTDAERNGGWGREDKGWVKRPGYSWRNLGQRVCIDDYPVMNVTWNDATAYCRWLSMQGGGRTYRLPSEAEWEYAARAGSPTNYHFGDDPAELGEYAWYGENSEGLYRAVGLKRPNPFGIYDLYGNRQEWCLDHFAVDYYAQSPTADPVCTAGGVDRAMRGGAHTDLARFCSAVTRWGQEADNPGAAGIRVVSEIE